VVTASGAAERSITVRKALATVLLSATALAVGFAGAVAPAAATDPTPDHGSPSEDCLTPDDVDFAGSWSRSAPGVLTATLTSDGEGALCEDVALNVSWYALAPTWNGSFSFSKADSTPQTLIAHGEDVVFEQGDEVGTKRGTDVTDELPLCLPYQIDLYTGAKIDTVGRGGHAGFVAGGIVAAAYGEDDQECQEPTPTPTEPSPTEPTTPTEPGTTQPTEPTETEPSETEPSGTEPTESTETESATTATTPSTTQVAGTATAPSTSQGPALAFTGASGTGALVGVAVLLVLGGAVALIVVNRRRLGATHQG
jgi:hypothetical protein